MALKPDRKVESQDISYFMYNTGERGGVVCQMTGLVPGSGGAMDWSQQRVLYMASASGAKPVGLLMNDVVNIDQSRQILNPFKSERQIGDKVLLMRRGWVVTNFLANGGAPTGNIPTTAYLGASGTLTTVNSNNSTLASGLYGVYDTAYPAVGQFMSRRDADGYAKVFISLP